MKGLEGIHDLRGTSMVFYWGTTRRERLEEPYPVGVGACCSCTSFDSYQSNLECG